MAKYIVIPITVLEYKTQTIKEVMKLPLTIQLALSICVGNLKEVIDFIKKNKINENDVYVIPHVSKLTSTIGKYVSCFHVFDNIEIDNASNSIKLGNRIFTLIDETHDEHNYTNLYFIELVEKSPNIGYREDHTETLTITLDEEAKLIKEIRRRNELVYANYFNEQQCKKG